MALLSAYVTNLGKYVEGELAGDFLEMPTTSDAVQALLKRIGVDGIRYEEVFISDYDTDIPGLTDWLGEYENIDELNHLACLLSELSPSDLELFQAALDMGDYSSSLSDIINLVHNLDCFQLYADISEDEELGHLYIEDVDALNVPDHILPYIDFEAYGRDARINEDGYFTSSGYVCMSSQFQKVYHGIADIPDEHKVFFLPKLSISEQMAAYQSFVDNSPRWDEQLIPQKVQPER